MSPITVPRKFIPTLSWGSFWRGCIQGMIHPAVVLAGPDANNRYDIATISTEHPDNPPRAPLNVFHPTTTITGDVSFYQRNVAHGDLRPWIDENTGNITQPMSQLQLARLKSQMISKFLLICIFFSFFLSIFDEIFNISWLFYLVEPATNGGYFLAASSAIGTNQHWGAKESVYPQPAFGQRYISHPSTFPVHYQNAHLPSFTPSNGQIYNLSTTQMAYGYTAPYIIYPDHLGGPQTSGVMERPPTYISRDSYYPHPSAFIGTSGEAQR